MSTFDYLEVALRIFEDKDILGILDRGGIRPRNRVLFSIIEITTAIRNELHFDAQLICKKIEDNIAKLDCA